MFSPELFDQAHNLDCINSCHVAWQPQSCLAMWNLTISIAFLLTVGDIHEIYEAFNHLKDAAQNYESSSGN